MPHIFISYAKKDTRALADKLFATINGMEGFTAWMDASLEAGDYWPQQIQREIRRADAMIVLLSPDVNREPSSTQLQSFVHNEINFAQHLHKSIIPILAQTTFSPVQIAGIEYIDFVRDEDTGIQRLLGRLQKLNSGEEKSLPPVPEPKSEPNAMHKSVLSLNLPLIGSVVGILTVLIAAFISLPPLFNNGGEGTQVADNTTLTEMGLVTESAINTDNPTNTLTNELATETPSPEPTLNEHEATLERAWNFAGITNDEWIPYIYTFEDGIKMALVPMGCFVMGSTEAQIQYAIEEFYTQREAMSHEQPAETYCIERPFWIDVTEVTQIQFRENNGQKERANYFTGNALPVESITWFEARNYCESLGKRLPTEAEWEFAARGIENLIFPWGNEFVAENVVYIGDSNAQTVNVISRPESASWVGTYDMAGNVWEWTSTIYGIETNFDNNFADSDERLFAYPYNPDDGRELNSDEAGNVRVLRGGSWYSDSSSYLRSASRYWNNPYISGSNRGFRCARDIEA